LNVSFEIHEGDFLTLAQESRQADSMLPREDEAMFDGVLLNPPYGKLGSESVARRGMRDLGVETPNVYAAFWAAAVALTRDGGDVVALTPRSFCNGTYYRDFRRFLLERAAIKQMHVYDSRDRAFSDDGVLQENLITHVVVGAGPQDVRVTAQSAPGTPARSRMVPYRTVVRPEDSDRLISVVPDADMDRTAGQVESFKCSIRDLGLKVSTGPVVDFRSRELIGDGVRGGAVPLIYPTNIRDGRVVWPVINKQASIEEAQAKLRRLLIPDGHYVLVKRFTAKEEPRRVVAGLLRPGGSMAAGVGIENHLNYFHEHGSPLNEHVAIGLTAYLNSSGVDAYLRRFSGHTQVNAGDLRAIPYPSLSVLTHVGARADLARLAEPTYFETLRSSPRPEQSSTLRNLG
jgi:adenine-specific DNA-methyltransferase